MIAFSLIIVQNNSNGLGFLDVSKTEQQVLLERVFLVKWMGLLCSSKRLTRPHRFSQGGSSWEKRFRRLWDFFTVSLAQPLSLSRSSRSKCWGKGRGRVVGEEADGGSPLPPKLLKFLVMVEAKPNLILSCGTWSADLSVPTSPTRCKIEKKKKKKNFPHPRDRVKLKQGYT